MSLHVATRRALLIPKAEEAADDGVHHLEATCSGDTTFDPAITASSTGHWVMGDGSADRDSNSFSHVYTGGPYDIEADWDDIADVTIVTVSSDGLTALDISALTSVTWVDCPQNSLSTLDVSALTAMTWFRCESNDLSVLDVSSNTALTYLSCGYQDIGTLDVTNLSVLTKLYCVSTGISTLNIANKTSLGILYCSSNSISTLDVSLLTALTNFNCSNNGMSEAAVDSVLADLVTAGASDGTCDISGTNAAPSAAGLASKATLETAGWTVTCST